LLVGLNGRHADHVDSRLISTGYAGGLWNGRGAGEFIGRRVQRGGLGYAEATDILAVRPTARPATRFLGSTVDKTDDT